MMTAVVMWEGARRRSFISPRFFQTRRAEAFQRPLRRPMAPLSNAHNSNASTRRSSQPNVIDVIHKKDGEVHNHIRARLPARLSARSVSEWLSAAETDPASVVHRVPSLVQRVPSVESPEDICGLSGEEWDLDEACWSDDACASADETTPANNCYLDHATSPRDYVLNEAEDCACADEHGELLHLLQINNTAPSSDLEDGAAMWAEPTSVRTRSWTSPLLLTPYP